jgi:uncharacterized protein (TIGR03086 family)
MTDEPTTAAVIGGIALLERAINYTLGSLHLVTRRALSNPTPCQDWDLLALLGHLNDSLLALDEAIDGGRVNLEMTSDDHDWMVDPVASLRNRACHLLGAWAAASRYPMISVGGYPLTSGIVTSTGAIEIAVHGWDIAQACGRHHPIPPALAEEMLDLSMVLVTGEDRPARFAAPIAVHAAAGPGDQLLAFLGRRPGTD